MCRRIDCPKCGRPSFAGCGRHVEQVLGDVSPADRCRCAEEASPPKEDTREQQPRSWLRALLGK